ncbi:squamosa promoter-binding-like protein 15 isoform X1 [Zingiber officinale]|uniref:squamosa promoter-binding-like protein 15 isoform X1 n=1 Tax=Zingiber officinale TaxID=94328 RepID=UPI001C4B8FBC|nr:squamosa promoter-binding-like protein 15 isoform X1 [Zingiber officinale]
MEGEVGAQVAPPIFFHHHQALPVSLRDAPLLAKKRDFPWKSSVFQHNRLPENQEHTMSASVANPVSNWNPNMWNWDSVQFTPTPASDTADVICLGSQSSSAAGAIVDQKKGDESSLLVRSMEEDDERLALKLGGGGCLAEEPAARPNKRVRSGSPGCSNYPMCQVDDCRTDLSSAKDYHRRHKVCEVHSKTAKALVGNQMQRFCQQCSRFHPLSAFDEGKRSCRRRLAGHNRRRRKTQPEVASPMLQPMNQENSASGHLDIVNLLSMLARLEGNSQDKQTNIPLFERDRFVQFISKLSTSNSGNPSARSLEPGGFDLNVSQDAPLVSIEKSIKEIGEISSPSATTKLLTVLSAAIAATTAAAPATVSQRSSQSSGNDKAKVQNAEPSGDANSHNKSTHMLPSVGVLPDNLISKSTVGACHQIVQQTRQSLPLQLFGPVEYDNPPELGSAIKYLSSESSNPLEERSPSSSPPVTKKLFPLHSTLEGTKYAQALECREENATVELSSINGGSAPLELFRVSEMQTENATAQRLPSRGGYKSSGSDHSPSSSNSDAQDRTGRIIFKLFGKDPSSFPDTLRSQVFNWLSHSPSDMESYIRPGCIVLSIYLSMPSVAWEELEDDLLERVVSLVQFAETDFWRNGRFLLRTNRQLVSHKDAKIRISRTWKAWSAPELTSVSPVAVVVGQKTSLLLKGRNLTVPGTKIHCTYMGKYMSKEILCSTYPGTIYDDSCVERFDFPGGSPEGFSRCFIEVENGFKGNSFPVIIANVSICQELRTLEADFEDALLSDGITEEQVSNSPRYRSREDSLHFLNELGWLFQRTQKSSSLSFSNFSSSRLKYLLTFSVERDWCTLIQALLDILVERSLNDDALKQESLELLSEIDLLSRAVKRKCRKMVDLLIQYYVTQGNDATKVYLFSPSMAGPGGITPLHMAASMQDSEDLVDALTNDPQEIGLKCWTSLLDENDRSPYMYALLRNNISYNNLIFRKLGDRTNGQLTIPVRDGAVVGVSITQGAQTVTSISCAQCAMIGARQLRRSPRTKGLLQRPYVHSMLAIAAVCVCVCLCFRGLPQIGSVEPFKWENLDFGPR